jgi:hypothetical protein
MNNDLEARIKKTKKVIFYIGKKDLYQKRLQERFKGLYSQIDFEFNVMFVEDQKYVKNLILELASNLNFNILFIDYSYFTQELISLTKTILFCHPLEKKVIIGLMNLDTSISNKRKISSEGILCHYKTNELSLIVYQSLYLENPLENNMPPFANVVLNLECNYSCVVRLGYFNENGVHIEAPFFIKKEDSVRLKFAKNLFFKNENFVVKNITNKNTFYNLPWALDLEFDFEENSESTQKLDLDEFKNFIKKNSNKINNKKYRVLIIDQNLNIIEDSNKQPDFYSFSVRFSISNDDKWGVVEKNFPQIIILTHSENMNFNNLQILVQKIKSINNYYPILILVNFTENKQELVKKLVYDKIIIYKGILRLDEEISKLIEVQKVMSEKLNQNEFEEKSNYYLSKYDEASFVEFNGKLKVLSISEAEIKFTSPMKFSPLTNLSIKIEGLENIDITIIPDKKINSNIQSGEITYTGFIHGQKIIDADNLRSFINRKVFEREIPNVLKEEKEFIELNEKTKAQKLLQSNQLKRKKVRGVI